MSKKKTFVLNDETKVNSYGFRVLNSGIDLDRFKSNPVMLDQHWNNTRSVIGNWENLRIEGSQLLADENFDMEDEDAKKVAGKVNRGFIKGASIGISYNYEFMERNPDDTYVLTSCELFEASIVAIPSNANAVTLFAQNGVELSADEVKLSLTKLTQTQNFNTNPKKMSKINLSAVAVLALAAVGVVNTDDENAVSNGIEQLSQKLSTANTEIATLKTANAGFETQLKVQKELQAKALVTEAKLAGKITAEEEAGYLADATANFELTAKFLAKIPAKTNLSGEVIKTDNGGNATDPKNIDEFEKMPLDKQLAFKAENPDGYSALFA